MVDSHTKVIHKSKNQGSQILVTITFNELFIQEELEVNVKEYE